MVVSQCDATSKFTEEAPKNPFFSAFSAHTAPGFIKLIILIAIKGTQNQN
jgi:hypothetical protein